MLIRQCAGDKNAKAMDYFGGGGESSPQTADETRAKFTELMALQKQGK